jgi:prepilin-type N-terminal cleavage/methylation domain-containing protein
MTRMSCRLKVEGYRLRHADFESAVSQNSILLTVRNSNRLGVSMRMPIENRRYSRLEICATSSKSSGFTLIELLIVCLLIALFAALIIPNMRGTFEDALLRSSGRNLIDVMNLTYSRSVSLNQLHRLRFDKYTGHYVIEKQVGDGQEDSDFEPATEIAGFSGQVDSHISIELQKSEIVQSEDADAEPDEPADTPSDVICFYPDGTADARDILLRDRMGFRLALQVNPNTARVNVLEANSKLQ